MTHIDIRTDTEKAREARHRAIRNDYLTMANEMPGTAPNRIFTVIASRYGMTVPGVRNILIKAGVYSSAK